MKAFDVIFSYNGDSPLSTESWDDLRALEHQAIVRENVPSDGVWHYSVLAPLPESFEAMLRDNVQVKTYE